MTPKIHIYVHVMVSEFVSIISVDRFGVVNLCCYTRKPESTMMYYVIHTPAVNNQCGEPNKPPDDIVLYPTAIIAHTAIIPFIVSLAATVEASLSHSAVKH